MINVVEARRVCVYAAAIAQVVEVRFLARLKILAQDYKSISNVQQLLYLMQQLWLGTVDETRLQITRLPPWDMNFWIVIAYPFLYCTADSLVLI